MSWKKLLRALGIGLLLTVVSYMITANDVSVPTGMLVAYLEYRFGGLR
jgi:hypothetical protein